MKRKRKIRYVVLLVIGFALLNSLLLYFDTGNKVEQKSYVNEWSEPFTYDLVEKLETTGVFASAESNHVYFDKNEGSFRQFLVAPGDEISEGDGLYEYEVTNFSSQTASLKAEAKRLEEEIEAIEQYIIELESFDIPETDNGGSSFFSQDEAEEEDQPKTIETEFMKQEQIAEKELELAQKEAKLTMVESQLAELEAGGKTITVESPFNGVITEISESLQSPLITMKTTTLQVEGKLTESERKKVQPDMEVEIKLPNEELPEQPPLLRGTISSLRNFPDHVSVGWQSEYPFEVSIEGATENILPGYHASLSIITARAEEAVTAFDYLLLTEDDLFAWVMNEKGTLTYRAIETGLEVNGMTEVTKGLETGEWLAAYPRDQFRKGATFLTPIQWEDLYIKQIPDVSPSVIKKYGLMGLMTR
ncbi:efflux RND transporter periplasmic adaptor subunit [Thalassobacillus pellis]|uniref:efflux RND transporter periplasmic adaptor subunit n=1 Tax=Thalassobacillus pellis TaxID=748008 RepID=UPI0019601F9F|nr:efflux RND transporter periplasmic adaptor subunit [Thalassobacillus pellis]MBM7554367.1 HlyD family secretion protein [Thalassobacillus pellis]